MPKHGAMAEPRTVLITGAARGIGRATTLRLAANGWTVYAGIRAVADGQRLVDAAGPSGAAIVPVPLDITSAMDVAALPDRIDRPLAAVVNNAGVIMQGPVETMSADQVRRLFEVNVVAQLEVTKALLPALRQTNGRVIFVSSLSGRVSTPLTGIYNASKFAVEALADALRVELRPWHVPVVVVEPGSTSTDMWGTAVEEHRAMIDALSPEQAALYGPYLEKSTRAVKAIQKRTVPAERVARAIERALNARRPNARYQVDALGRAQLVSTALTPTRVVDAIVGRATGFHG